jgi:imidazole glycerol-phosphate synthase subunit HisF
MGLAKRIIPCLDVIGNTTVKGVNFSGMVPLGSPVEMATLYCRQGADELVFLDIEASVKNTGTIFKVIEEVAGVVDVPFTVGGGISEIGHVEKLMESGADKISLNSAALLRPSLISDIARRISMRGCGG